ncbi:GNAT family N-acetyltransferase [Bacillus sp. B1-b2]|uniref:GNAT family N-acetyltransferase n=1 Tax=Bacillus sp. B1-b2 TaxID=2653201 RepID=UPI001D024BDE|nr:GNAT family N-acetyltransferase [Bacillus sp. B1-b2]
MKDISYDYTYEEGQIVKETENWKHVHNPEMLLQYDSNYIQFKSVPTIEGFTEAEAYLRSFHHQKGQEHLKFIFPENNELPKKLLEELVLKKDYEVGFTELYAVNPSDFPVLSINPDIIIKEVTSDNLEDFLQLEYSQDLEYGKSFADGKVHMYKQNFTNSSFLQLLAYYKGRPAGALEVIIAEKTVEIDGIFVIEEFQRKGIAARLQKYVMEKFPEKVVILLADGEDTPKEMYKKQNYVLKGFQYEALKEKME